MANRIELYDIMKIAYEVDLATIKLNIDKLNENELVYSIAEKSIYIKIGGKLFNIPLEEVI